MLVFGLRSMDDLHSDIDILCGPNGYRPMESVFV